MQAAADARRVASNLLKEKKNIHAKSAKETAAAAKRLQQKIKEMNQAKASKSLAEEERNRIAEYVKKLEEERRKKEEAIGEVTRKVADMEEKVSELANLRKTKSEALKSARSLVGKLSVDHHAAQLKHQQALLEVGLQKELVSGAANAAKEAEQKVTHLQNRIHNLQLDYAKLSSEAQTLQKEQTRQNKRLRFLRLAPQDQLKEVNTRLVEKGEKKEKKEKRKEKEHRATN